MTIHEIEEKTGMTRANIRYYERAGLLSPERCNNNYRDYSEADLTALQRVRLLRSLRIPVSEIARLQAGETELASVLAAQSEKLHAESDELSEAAVLCRELREAQVSYFDLDAERWLRRAETTAEKTHRWQPLTLDVLPTAPWLWKRFLARGLDLMLISAAMTILRMLVLRWSFAWEWWIVRRYYGWIGMPDRITMWINALAAFGVLAVLEPLLLCTAGTTPGKWLFGLYVCTPEGGKLTFRQGLKRIWGVFVRGLGCTIPFYSLWRLWKSYRDAKKGNPLPWDRDTCCESGKRRLCGLWFVLANAACAAAVFLAFAQAVLPLHTGELTVRELADNCSMFMRQFRGRPNVTLSEEGRWVDERDPDSLHAVYSLGNDPAYRFETDSRGIVTAVHIDYEDYPEDGESFSIPDDTDTLYFAYVMANNHVTPWELLRRGSFHWIARGLPDPLEDFTVTDGCIRITNQFSYSGYETYELPDGQVFEIPLEGEEQVTHWALSMERAGEATETA